jgi:hypothetical protein
VKKLMTASLFLLIARSALGASGYALVWGGSCNWNDVDFKAPMVGEAQTLSSRGWNVTLGFDKNPNEIEPSLLIGYRGTVQDGSKKTLFDFLDQVQSQAKKGQEVLIVVETHGSEETSKQAHEWVLPDCSRLSVDDKDLQDKLAQLQKKGIRIAVSDESCFSGNSVSHLQNYGCVLSNQGNNESAGSAFANSVVFMNRGHPSDIPMTDVFREMLQDQSSFYSADENGFLASVPSIAEQPQMSGFTKSSDVSNQDGKSTQAEVDVYSDSFTDACVGDFALSAFDAFENALTSQVKADDDVLTKVLEQTIQKDDSSLKEPLQTQDRLLKEINGAIAAESALPVNQVVIDLKSIDPAFVGILDQLSHHNMFAENWANASGSSFSVSSDMVKNGKLIIPWQMKKNDPEVTASRFLSALERTQFGKTLKNIPNLDQKIRAAAAVGEATSLADLPAEQKAVLDKSDKTESDAISSLHDVQRLITDSEIQLDQDVRTLRTTELDRISGKPSQLSRDDRKRFENCAKFRL